MAERKKDEDALRQVLNTKIPLLRQIRRARLNSRMYLSLIRTVLHQLSQT